MVLKIQDLSLANKREICSAVQDWTKVMYEIPSYTIPNRKRFCVNDVKILEDAVKNGFYESGMIALLSEWETMGLSRRPNVKDLLKHLLEADELAAASIINEKILEKKWCCLISIASLWKIQNSKLIKTK